MTGKKRKTLKLKGYGKYKRKRRKRRTPNGGTQVCLDHREGQDHHNDIFTLVTVTTGYWILAV